MQCNYCRYSNPDGEHRCVRCGRRLAEMAAAAAAGGTAVAYALAPAFPEPEAPAKITPPAPPQPRARQSLSRQALLFHETNNVIPFDTFAAHRIEPLPEFIAPSETAGERKHARAAVRRQTPSRNDKQSSLDLLPLAPQTPRRLKTNVHAVIGCDLQAANPKQRAAAAALDGVVIAIAFSLFLEIFHLFGGVIRPDKQTAIVLAGALSLIALFYGLLWALAARETAGMRWVDLRLIDFDGFPPDARSRALRLAACCLSFSAGGLGVLWALMDEEKLTWHDHMSKTFPAVKESDSSFFRKAP